MNDPLHDLSTVDWESLSHAYGPATDVPGLLQTYWSGSIEERDEVLQQLYSNIWHQRTVYEATPATARFLVEMVDDERCPAPGDLMALLFEIARGMNYIDQHASSDRFRLARGDPEIEQTRADGRRHVALSRDAVHRGLPVYRRRLEDPEAKCRLAAAILLAELLQEEPGIASLVLDCLERDSSSVAFGLAAALLMRGADEMPDPAEVVRRLSRRPDSTEREFYRLAFTAVAGDDEIRGELVDEFFDCVISLDPASELAASAPELAGNALVPGSRSHIRFACLVFPFDSLMEYALVDAAAYSLEAARVVCDEVLDMLEDPEVELDEGQLARALNVLGSAGSPGIEALESLDPKEHLPVSLALSKAKAIAERYRDARLWHQEPDPTWTIEDCITQIDEHLTLRFQDRSARMRAILRLIEFGSDAAPAHIAHRIAELRDDHAHIAAANLLWSATEDPSLVLPLLEGQLDRPESDADMAMGRSVILAADLARRMGPSGSPLLPLLRELEGRSRIVRWGLSGELPFIDEAARAIVVAAIDAIDS